MESLDISQPIILRDFVSRVAMSEIVNKIDSSGSKHLGSKLSDNEMIVLINAVAERKKRLFGLGCKSTHWQKEQRRERHRHTTDYLWLEIADIVNCVSEHHREANDLRKAFTRLRFRVKKKAARDKDCAEKGDESVNPVVYSVVEKTILPLIEHTAIHGLEGIPDSEEFPINNSIGLSEAKVIFGDEGESITIYDTSSLTESSTTSTSDSSSSREVSPTNDTFEKIDFSENTQNYTDKIKKSDLNLFKVLQPKKPTLKINPRVPYLDNKHKQLRIRALQTSSPQPSVNEPLKSLVVNSIVKKSIETPINYDLVFFKSILPDLKDLNASQKRQFKQKILLALDDICNERTHFLSPFL